MTKAKEKHFRCVVMKITIIRLKNKSFSVSEHHDIKDNDFRTK